MFFLEFLHIIKIYYIKYDVSFSNREIFRVIANK